MFKKCISFCLTNKIFVKSALKNQKKTKKQGKIIQKDIGIRRLSN